MYDATNQPTWLQPGPRHDTRLTCLQSSIRLSIPSNLASVSTLRSLATLSTLFPLKSPIFLSLGRIPLGCLLGMTTCLRSLRLPPVQWTTTPSWSYDVVRDPEGFLREGGSHEAGKDLTRSAWVRREMRRDANGLGIVRWMGPGTTSDDDDEGDIVDGSAEMMCDLIRRASGEGANLDEVDDEVDASVWRAMLDPRMLSNVTLF